MALKFPNVYLGTGAYPPRHWPGAVVDFLARPGPYQGDVRHQLPDRRATATRSAQVAELGLAPDVEAASLGATARRVFTRLATEGSGAMIGKVYGIPPQPPVEEHTHRVAAGAVTLGVEYRALDPGVAASRPTSDNPEHLAELEARSPEGGFTDEGVSLHVCGTDDGHEYVRFDVFADEPHYHYVHNTGAGGEIVNNVIDFDAVASRRHAAVGTRASPHATARDAAGGRGWRGGGDGRSRPGGASGGRGRAAGLGRQRFMK